MVQELVSHSAAQTVAQLLELQVEQNVAHASSKTVGHQHLLGHAWNRMAALDSSQ